MEMMSFITEAFIVVIPTLSFLGWVIKNTEFVMDELIPVILCVLGVLLCSGIAQTIDTNTIIQGILCAGVSVLGNQTFKQLSKIEQ